MYCTLQLEELPTYNTYQRLYQKQDKAIVDTLLTRQKVNGNGCYTPFGPELVQWICDVELSKIIYN